MNRPFSLRTACPSTRPDVSSTAGLVSWWRHHMEAFSALPTLCARNSPVTGEFPSQRPVTPSFDISFDLCLNKRLSKQSWGWWLETPSCSLWRHCNVESPCFEILIWHNEHGIEFGCDGWWVLMLLSCQCHCQWTYCGASIAQHALDKEAREWCFNPMF